MEFFWNTKCYVEIKMYFLRPEATYNHVVYNWLMSNFTFIKISQWKISPTNIPIFFIVQIPIYVVSITIEL